MTCLAACLQKGSVIAFADDTPLNVNGGTAEQHHLHRRACTTSYASGQLITAYTSIPY